MTIDIRSINLLTSPQRLANALIYGLIAFTSISCGSGSNQDEIDEEAIKKLTTELGEVRKIAEETKETANKAQVRLQETESQKNQEEEQLSNQREELQEDEVDNQWEDLQGNQVDNQWEDLQEGQLSNQGENLQEDEVDDQWETLQEDQPDNQ